MRRTRAYMRARYKKLAYARRALNHGPSVFGEREFPKATLLSREPVERVSWELRRWAVAQWTWVRPRTVPILVALAGMIFVLISADYLAHVHATPMHAVPAFK
jgi:hypothetical protein